MNTLTETDKAYLAGLIDGEGCITIGKQLRPDLTPTPAYAMRLIIAQSDKDFLEHWHEIVGIGVLLRRSKESVGKHIQPKYRDNCLEVYTWQLSSKEAAQLLREVLPYLVMKKRQAEIALHFQSTMDRSVHGGSRTGAHGGNRVPQAVIDIREKCYLAIKSRNQREYQNLLNELPADTIPVDDIQMSMF
jgi:hypothetical protein